MPQSLQQHSNEYWSQSPEQTSQWLYVAFCELASAALDFSEGARTRFDVARNDERSNWASTALYYSIVHAARLLVFLPFGDFPTRHDQLASCFQLEGAESTRTNWLNAFLRVSAFRFRRDLRHVRYSTEIAPVNLYEAWRHIIADEQTETFLEWLGVLLEQAKALRNENNYEALLIAHEYDHTYMSDLFTQFTSEMYEGAKRTLGFTAKWFDRYLKASNNLPAGAHAFIAEYVERRILNPVSAWYGDRVAAEIRDLLAPLSVDPMQPYSREANDIQRAVDFAIFDPKAGLMNDFRGKVESLSRLVRQR
jgi:hypothetical protein